MKLKFIRMWCCVCEKVTKNEVVKDGDRLKYVCTECGMELG